MVSLFLHRASLPWLVRAQALQVGILTKPQGAESGMEVRD